MGTYDPYESDIDCRYRDYISYCKAVNEIYKRTVIHLDSEAYIVTMPVCRTACVLAYVSLCHSMSLVPRA